MTDEELMKAKKQFVELCANVRLGHRVTDRAIIRRHNGAQKKLNALCSAMCSQPERAAAFFRALMQDEDIRVSCTAAGYALHKGISVPDALARLRRIAEGEDKDAAFTAAMAISVWKLQTEDDAEKE